MSDDFTGFTNLANNSSMRRSTRSSFVRRACRAMSRLAMPWSRGIPVVEAVQRVHQRHDQLVAVTIPPLGIVIDPVIRKGAVDPRMQASNTSPQGIDDI
jgi:hypothetical protein